MASNYDMLVQGGWAARLKADVDPKRLAVILEAHTWIGTPFHPNARVRGSGVDCGRILVEVYGKLGFRVPEFAPVLPRDWHHHRSEEVYLTIVQRFATEITGPPETGDIAMFHIGRVWGHSAIVVKWPSQVIHVNWLSGVEYADAEQPPLKGRIVRFFSPFQETKQ